MLEKRATTGGMVLADRVAKGPIPVPSSSTISCASSDADGPVKACSYRLTDTD